MIATNQGYLVWTKGLFLPLSIKGDEVLFVRARAILFAFFSIRVVLVVERVSLVASLYDAIGAIFSTGRGAYWRKVSFLSFFEKGDKLLFVRARAIFVAFLQLG